MTQATGDAGNEQLIDSGQAAHVRDAWLRLRIFDHVDAGSGGGFAYDPSNYAAVPIQRDGEMTLVFART